MAHKKMTRSSQSNISPNFITLVIVIAVIAGGEATAQTPTVEFTRNGGITSVDEPAAGENLTLRFDYTISDIPASSSFTSITVRFGTLGPDDVPTPADELPHTPSFSDPNPLVNGRVFFDSMSAVEYRYNDGFSFPATFSENIRYRISADNKTTDNNFNLGITSVVLSGGSGNNITIPGADINVPGGRHVTAGDTTYAVQTILIANSQTAAAVTYSLDDPEAIEPANADANANPGLFTLTLSDLTADQQNSRMRRFFFGFAPSDTGGGVNLTPGFGTLHNSLAGSTHANPADFDLSVEYRQPGRTDLTVTALVFTGDTYNTAVNVPRAGGGTEEVYTFRVVPKHDTGDEGMEPVAFGYRVFFSGTDSQAPDELNRVAGTVNGDPATMPAMTIADPPIATLTRDRVSITEGSNANATFTLALSNAPNVRSTVTSTITIAGDNPSRDDLNVSIGGAAGSVSIIFMMDTAMREVGPISTPGVNGSDSFGINITNNTADFTLQITPRSDNDSTNEIVTFAITSIEFEELVLGPGDLVCPESCYGGALSIYITENNDPLAIITSDDPEAVEPTSTTADDAKTAAFTIRLINLNSGQAGAGRRTFFFNPAENDVNLDDLNTTPGRGSLPGGITAATWSNDLTLQYVPENGNPATNDNAIPFNDGAIYRRDGGSVAKTSSEIYAFRVIPTHDDARERLEHVVFGYRVFFQGQGNNQIRGFVNTTNFNVSIADPNTGIRLRIRTFLEGALQ